MPKPPQQPPPEVPQVTIRDFAGLVPNADPHDLQPGAAIAQVNCTAERPGELRVRPGFAVVKFD